MARVIDLNPVIRITAGAVGKPGQRVFYIQAETASQRVTVVCEKQQVQALGLGVQEYLQEVQRDHPDLLTPSGSFLDSDMDLQEPIEPLFRVGQFGLGYDDESDRVILVVQEEQAEEANPDEATTVRFWVTRSQLLAMAQHGMEIAARGRPICGNCLQPIDAEGHFCPRRNGHRY